MNNFLILIKNIYQKNPKPSSNIIFTGDKICKTNNKRKIPTTNTSTQPCIRNMSAF